MNENLNFFRDINLEPDLPRGVWLRRERVHPSDQEALLRDVDKIIAAAPLLRPRMPHSGVPFRLTLTSAGEWGWWSDRDGFGYRYVDKHPTMKVPWPVIPRSIMSLAQLAADEAGYRDFMPDSCLVNVYEAGEGSLGLHRDMQEADRTAPIVSVSLGASCVFAIGGEFEGSPKVDVTLKSGDVLVMGGPARDYYHAVKKVLPNTSGLCGGRRINLTIRRHRKG